MARLVLPKTATIQSRKSYQIDRFFGVDYTTSKFGVSDYHSISSLNFIRRDNSLQKRFGYKQVYDFLDTDKKIYNFFSFLNKSGETIYIANVNGSLYQYKNDEFYLLKEEACLSRSVVAFPSNHRLYILGGKKYLVIEEDENGILLVEEVANSKFAFVPTTTIGITPNDLEFSKRTSLDSANLLTYWRKNRLISGLHYKSTDDKEVLTDTVQEFMLDNSINAKTPMDYEEITVKITFNDQTAEQFEINNATSLKEVEFRSVFCKGLNLKGIDDKHTKDELVVDEAIQGLYILVHYADGDFNESYKEQIKDVVISGDENTAEQKLNFKVYGYINLSGSVVLFNDYNNPTTDNNITVLFPCYNAETYENNYIDECFIGKVYNSNNINSLFVAGSTRFPARDWHTEEINSSSLENEYITTKDLVYFPDTSYCDYGEDNKNPILGYDVLGTGDLLVLKKYQKYEPTIYFRTGQLVAVKDDYGKAVSDLVGSQLYKPEYSLTTGNIGKSILNYMQIVNFNGDTLFIANDKTIQGLDKETKSYDNQRYANTRSFYLDNYLKTKNLENAFFFDDEDYLFVGVNNELFVNYYGEVSNNNYEWYHLKYDVNLIGIFTINKTKYFSDDEGRLYKLFEENSFVDTKTIAFKEGEAMIKGDTNEIVLSSSLFDKVIEDDKLVFKDKVLSKFEYQNFDETKMTFTSLDTYLTSSTMIKYKSKIYTTEKNGINFTLTEYIETREEEEDNNLYILLDQLVVIRKDLDTNKVYLSRQVAYDTSVLGYFERDKIVECFYITAPILFDTLYTMYYKNIWSILITNDTGLASEISIDLIDNRLGIEHSSNIAIGGYSNGYTLDNLSFEAYSLEQNQIPVKTYTIYRNIIKKEYVALKFYNFKNTNCVLSQINFTYSLGGVIR